MQAGEFAMAVAKISVDAATGGRMTGIVRVGQCEVFQDTELRFDHVQPRGFSRCPDRFDP
jgi:hypothetical protein